MIFLYIILLVIALLFYILYEGLISFLIFVFACTLPVIELILTAYVKHKITVRLDIKEKQCSTGENIPMTITLENKSLIPVLSCEITLGYTINCMPQTEKIKIDTPVFPCNTQRHTVHFSSEHFGSVSCRILSVKIRDALRLKKFRLSKKRIIQPDTSILFIPEIIGLTNAVCDYSDSGIDSDRYSGVKAGTDPSEIFDIREYRDGDKMSRVHWKLTAKQDELMVREYSLPLVDCCRIVTDTHIPPQTSEKDTDNAKLYDTAIQLAVSLSALLTEKSERHSICTYSESQNRLNEYTVSDHESHLNACTRLISDGSCSKPNLAAAAIVSDDEIHTQCGHLILITSQIDERTAFLISESRLAYRYTILLCTADPNADISKYPHAENVALIPVYSGAIAESVAELVI
jgi:uncharacterized protein (DUF58 family)